MNLEIYYQNVRGLRTKLNEFYSNVCSNNFNMICLTETWLNTSISDSFLFPNNYTVYRSDRDPLLSNKLRGGGVLIAVDNLLHSKRRHDLELTPECLWIELPDRNNTNYLIGNHYFPPNIDPNIVITYFRNLEQLLNPSKFNVILLGDFNVPGIDWPSGHFHDNIHFYAKNKGIQIYSTSLFLGLNQINSFGNTTNLLDLIFTNILNVEITATTSPLVPLDYNHPSLILNIHTDILHNTSTLHGYLNYTQGVYEKLAGSPCFATVNLYLLRKVKALHFSLLLHYSVNSGQFLNYVYIDICPRRRVVCIECVLLKKGKTHSSMRGISSNIHQVIKPMDYN